MRKKKAPLYSQNHTRFEPEDFLRGKALYESGSASLTYLDPLSGEVHGNVKEEGRNFAIGLSFSLDGSLSGASCSCKGNSAHPCRHMAATLLALEEQVGEKAEASLPDFLFYLETIAPLSEVKGPSCYFEKAKKELLKRGKKWGWDEPTFLSGLKSILKGTHSYSGFGDEKTGRGIASSLLELNFGQSFLTSCLGEIPSLLSLDARRGFYLGFMGTEDGEECFLERFDAGLTNGGSYDLLRLFLGREEELFSALPARSLHLLCSGDFRFKGFLPLSVFLLRTKDAEGLVLLSENPYCELPSEMWKKMGEELENDGRYDDALPCYKKMFGLLGGDFSALASYWKGLSEEEKKEKEGDLLASLSPSLLPPFRFLIGKGRAEDISSFRLYDFPVLQEELRGFPYEPVLLSKAKEAMKDPGLDQKGLSALWDCFSCFDCLEPYLLSKEAESLSEKDPSSRVNYLSSLAKRGLLEKKGLYAYEERR
ncbi:SWIM zinc finger family protein [bacterium]|nr:SWIM zinc finger family protein [bacterium]